MFVLSFDIGTKNLAYCYSDNENIIEWDVVDIYDKDIYSMTKKCFNFLEVKFASKDIEVVLIENQPAQKNPKMKSIQMIVFGFFAYKQHVAKQNINNIFFQSANNKNKFSKKMGIEVP
jgi:hypothetical protein